MNNSNEKNATKHDNPMYLCVLIIISNGNLTQFLDVANVNSGAYNNANTTDKTWFSGVQK